MSDNTNGYNPTREQQQNMDNLSFDRKYLVNSVENLVEDEAGTKVERMVQPAKETTVVTNAITQSEEAILLRRIVKLLESNAVVDVQGRQKIIIESIAGTTLGASVTGLSSGAGVPCVNDPTANAPRPSPGTTYWQPVWIGPVDQRFQIIDAARLTYDQAIRSHLSFT